MLAALITASTETLDDNDVVAGWTAFWIFVALAVAVAFLLWNFTKQLKKTDRAAKAGVFGPVDDAEPAEDAPGAAAAAEEAADEPDTEHRATNGG
ncbi:MAG TPA: hypothetical protein VNS55_00575 [Nocardioides sp.]|nr:hypothetical protein [Nocardioides sp.]